MHKILVVNVNWLGDVIFSSAVFKNLKQTFPQAKITCLAVPRVKDILESISDVDHIIVYDEKGRHSNLFSKIDLIMQLRREKFDVVFLLHRSLTRALLVWFAGIPKRIGYNTKNRGLFLTHKIIESKELLHRCDYYLRVIEEFGVPIKSRQSALTISSKVDLSLEKHGLKDNDLIVVINPGGNWDLKRWPAKNFSLLIEMLLAKTSAKVVVSGGEKDVNLVKKIVSVCSIQPIVLTGELNLKELMVLMKKASVVVSGDSGPLHIASSVGTNVVGIFGPTRPEITSPRGSGAATILQHDVGCNKKACYFLDCPDNVCMQAVTVEEVFEAVRKNL